MVQPYPLSPQESLPTMYDLPSEDPEELGLPDLFHLVQPRLLDESLRSPVYSADQVLTASDLNLYYDPTHPRWYKRPDWFMVLGKSPAQSQAQMHLSYVIWQEGTLPYLVIELLSPGTAAEDLGRTLREVNTPPTKWQVYEQILRIPYYIVYDRYENQLRVFRLVTTRYEEVALTESRFWFDEIEAGLGIWQGSYQGTEGLWLRWYDGHGNWAATPREQAEQNAEQSAQLASQERERAEQSAQLAAQERERAETLAAKLRELGIDPTAL
jgi:Uma2 family endonuclease